MNEEAILLVSNVLGIAFVFSLIIAALVFRTAWRTKQVEKQRQRTTIATQPDGDKEDRPEP